MKISIIVPAYQSELWINDCVNSILAQTYKNWELIIVVDGGNDGTLEIAQTFEKFDSRITCVFQENQGLGGARRTGINSSTGDFILFLDSDDLLLEDALHRYIEYQKQYDADLIVSDFSPFQDGDEFVAKTSNDISNYFKKIVSKFTGVCNWRVFSQEFDFAYPGIYFTVAWGKLYKRELWLSYVNENYPPLRYAEDFYPTKSYAISCQKIIVAPFVSMHYRLRKSGMAKSRSRNAPDIVKAFWYTWPSLRGIKNVYPSLENDVDRFYIYMLVGQLFKNVRYFDMLKYVRDIKKCLEKMSGVIINDNDAENIRKSAQCGLAKFILSLIRYWKLRFN